MKIDAVGVTSSNLKKSVEFYTILGFKFPEFKSDENHLEPETPEGSARLMLDSVKLSKQLNNQDPKPSNHSQFAISYDNPKEIDDVVKKLKEQGFKISKEPWDAFWGQRYCVVEDPDGYLVDLYTEL